MKVCLVIDKSNEIFLNSLEEACKNCNVEPYSWILENDKSFSSQRERFLSYIKAHSIDKIIVFNDFRRGDECFLTDQIFKDRKVILWSIDPMYKNKNRVTHFHKFFHIYSFEPKDIEFLECEYNISASYLPFTVGENNFCTSTPYEDENRPIDVSFIGLVKGNEKRLIILNEIAKICKEKNYKFSLYGAFWHYKHWYQRILGAYKFKRKYPDLFPYVFNQYVSPIEAAQIYKTTKICLNIHSEGHTGPNCRTFEVLGGNNFLLMDEVDMSGIALEPYIHYGLFTSPDDAAMQVVYYLENFHKRKELAEIGGFKVRNFYTFTHILQKITEDNFLPS